MKDIRIKTKKHGTAIVTPRCVYKNLCIHDTYKGPGYTVTHIKSGLRILISDTLRLAQKAARLLETMPGWDTAMDAKDFTKQQISYFLTVREFVDGDTSSAETWPAFVERTTP